MGIKKLQLIFFFISFVTIGYFAFCLLIVDKVVISEISQGTSSKLGVEINLRHPFYSLLIFWYHKISAFIITCIIMPTLVELFAVIIENPTVKNLSKIQIKQKVGWNIVPSYDILRKFFIVSLLFVIFFFF